MGWNERSHEELPKNILSMADKTSLRALRHKQTNIILEARMVGHVSFMRKYCQKNGTCDKMQRAREKKMLRSSVGELVDWTYETTYEYDMAPSLSTYLMSQGELNFWRG